MARLGELVDHDLCPFLEDLQVRNSILDEHGAKHLTTVLPLLSIGSEDRVTEQRRPDAVKLGSLAVFCKFGGQDRLDVFRLFGDEVALTSSGIDGNRMGDFRGSLGLHDLLEVFKHSILAL